MVRTTISSRRSEKSMETITAANLGALAKALSKLQGEVENAAKSKQGHGYKYAELSSILENVRPLLAKYGLAVAQFPKFEDGKVGVRSILLHEEGAYLEDTIFLELEGNRSMNAAQVSGSIISYARRYALAAILGVAQEDDDGRQFASTSPSSEQKPVVAAKPKQAEKDWPAFVAQAKSDIAKMTTDSELANWHKKNAAEVEDLSYKDSALYQDVLGAWKARKTEVQSNPQPAITTGDEPDVDVAKAALDKLRENIDDEIPF